MTADLVLAELRAVVFDVGETLVDESRAWSEQARVAGVESSEYWPYSGTSIAGRRATR